jgi:hypothetical protein
LVEVTEDKETRRKLEMPQPVLSQEAVVAVRSQEIQVLAETVEC